MCSRHILDRVIGAADCVVVCLRSSRVPLWASSASVKCNSDVAPTWWLVTLSDNDSARSSHIATIKLGHKAARGSLLTEPAVVCHVGAKLTEFCLLRFLSIHVLPPRVSVECPPVLPCHLQAESTGGEASSFPRCAPWGTESLRQSGT